MTRFAAPVVAALLMAGTGATPAPAAGHRGRCDAHRARTETRSVLVFGKVAASDSGGNTSTLFYACARPNGRPHPIGLSSAMDGVYASDNTLFQLKIAGPYVAAWLQTSNAAATEQCSKYMVMPCPPPNQKDFIKVIDVRSGRASSLTTNGASRTQPLALSPLGAVAWLDSDPPALHATRLVARGQTGLGGAPRLIDRGNIAPASVRLVGLVLRWSTDGKAHSIPL